MYWWSKWTGKSVTVGLSVIFSFLQNKSQLYVLNLIFLDLTSITNYICSTILPMFSIYFVCVFCIRACYCFTLYMIYFCIFECLLIMNQLFMCMTNTFAWFRFAWYSICHIFNLCFALYNFSWNKYAPHATNTITRYPVHNIL